MDFLARDTVKLPESFWENVDKTIIDTIRKNLVGRKFLNLFGPIGPGALSVLVDTVSISEESEDGVVKTTGRQFAQLPQIYEEFTLFWRDLEYNKSTGYPMDLSAAIFAAAKIAKKEDKLIFFGNEFIQSEGLLTASGITKMTRGDWSTGENAFSDIASALSAFRSKGIIGKYSLILSPDLYVELQRIQPGLGVMEIDRITNLLSGNLFNAPVLGSQKALLVCAEPQYMDLAIGQDMVTAYQETKDLNHIFRILETAALRLKCKDAVIVFE